MATFARIFVVATVAETHKLFLTAIRNAERLEIANYGTPRRALAAAQKREIQRAYGRYVADMDQLSIRTAREATQAMQARLKATATRRPATGTGPHLSGALKSVALDEIGFKGTGMVGVAAIKPLDDLRDPNYPGKAWWWTQEEGYTGHVGRKVYGGFYTAGFASGPFAPASQFSGQGGPHPVFLPSRKAAQMQAEAGFAAAKGGSRMTIRHPIRARHFIRDGANIAQADWLRSVRAAESTALAGLATVIRGPGGGRARRP